MDEHYIDKVLQGDTAAYSFLVNKYKDMCYTVSYRILKDSQDAEDCVQEAFLNAYKNIRSFKRDARFSTWLFGIVYNITINCRNKRAKYPAVEISTRDREAGGKAYTLNASHMESNDRRYFINLAMEQLEEDENLVLTLYYLNECSVDEICGITGWTNSNVKIKLHRSRKKLHEKIQNILKNETRELL